VDPPLKTWIFAKPDVVAIEYHTHFPYPGDPFYLYAMPEQDARRQYYGVGSVPRVQMDGPDRPSPMSPTGYGALYQDHKAIPSAATLEMAVDFDGVTHEGTVEVSATVDAALPGDWRLRIALIQMSIHYEAPNGIDEHDHVFRRFVGGPEGTAVSFDGPFPQTIVVTLPFTVDADWPDEDMRLVALLQNDDDQWIDQGAITGLQPAVSTEPPGEVLPPRAVIHAVLPSPFTPRTAVSFTTTTPGRVRIAVYDATGRQRRVLVDAYLDAGAHTAAWDGRDDAERAIAPGVYFVRLDDATGTSTRRAILVR
jgi:hypothetical protein